MNILGSIKENKRVRTFTLLFFIFSIFFLSVYIIFQQYIRLTANDYPDRVTGDIYSAVRNGTMKQFYGPQGEISDQAYPFAVIFDADGKAGDTPLKVLGKPITLPQGVLDYAKAHGEDRVTWEPVKGSRFAAIVTYVPTFIADQSIATTSGRTGDLYILAAISLRESERHIAETGVLILKGWVASVILAGLFSLFLV